MALVDYKCLHAIYKAIKDREYDKGIDILNELIEQKDLKEEVISNKDSAIDMEVVHNEKYKDSIFEKQDMYLYRGIMQFYLKNYLAALSDFDTSYFTKQEAENRYEDNKSQIESNSIDTDLSDVGLCALNVNEYRFNIILCNILVHLKIISR